MFQRARHYDIGQGREAHWCSAEQGEEGGREGGQRGGGRTVGRTGGKEGERERGRRTPPLCALHN